MAEHDETPLTAACQPGTLIWITAASAKAGRQSDQRRVHRYLLRYSRYTVTSLEWRDGRVTVWLREVPRIGFNAANFRLCASQDTEVA